MTASAKPINYLDQAKSDRSIRRIKQLLLDGEMSYREMVEILNAEGYRTIRGLLWNDLNLRQVVWKIKHQERSWYGLSARRANLVIGVEA